MADSKKTKRVRFLDEDTFRPVLEKGPQDIATWKRKVLRPTAPRHRGEAGGPARQRVGECGSRHANRIGKAVEARMRHVVVDEMLRQKRSGGILQG